MSIRKFKKQLNHIGEEYIFKLLKKVPGEQRFGLYRFLPFFFVFGASLEYLMINWTVGPNQVNFYTSLKRREAEKIVENKFELEKHLKIDQEK